MNTLLDPLSLRAALTASAAAAAAATERVPGGSLAVTIDGEPYQCIRDVDAMPPFLMSVVSNSDHWLFVGSNGAFTAGRADADHALFPYQTVDKLLRHADTSGALSLFRLAVGGGGHHPVLWEPWQHDPSPFQVTRNLYKHVLSTEVLFEETNHTLGLRFRAGLTTSEAYGFVRRCTLENLAADDGDEAAPLRLHFLDGWHQLLPPGVKEQTFSRYSYLAAAYMRHEYLPETRLGIFTLNSGIVDRAEPSESLRAACAWSLGLDRPATLLCERQLRAFRRGELLQPEREVRGEFGAYLTGGALTLAPGEIKEWFTVADTGLDHSRLLALRSELADPARLKGSLLESIRCNRQGLRRRIAAADGLQETADHAASAHHFSNVLFNCMRGGTLADGYHGAREDLRAFIHSRNTATCERHTGWLDTLPERIRLDDLLAAASARGDAQLLRLVREYLPLCFSRRHGDPSRPWNRFEIHVKDEHGNPLCGYQGNWRDIFQNWEALAQSYPLCLEGMIAIFLNASTADGYNPYRLSRAGIEWEVLDPADAWSHIGYWGDHQIIYLLRLLESRERFSPGSLAAGLGERLYASAVVPYEIKSFADLCADPGETIVFNEKLHAELTARARRLGGDGKLLLDGPDHAAHVTLAEKLLVPLLAKLSNLVPGGGVWLNTQRPEWNDANNALAGWGLSMVTVYYLRRYLVFVDRVFAGQPGPVEVSAAVAQFLRAVTDALQSHAAVADDRARYACLAALGRAGEEHRRAVYTREPGPAVSLPVDAARALFAAALVVVDATIRENRRPDGTYGSYNLLALGNDAGHGTAQVRRLGLMLEGQVAALSSGALDTAAALALLQTLRASELFRADQNSYLLYPDREIAPFLSRNILPHDWAARAPLLAALADAGNRALVVRDDAGGAHFAADLTNPADVHAALDRLAGQTPAWADAVRAGRAAVLALWEAVFHHSAFTGRSGSMFAFEGLGSIYWHMVAKLGLAVQECHARARVTASPEAAAGLAAAYQDIRGGLGFTKTPQSYGAFPIDAYSHTPAHRGAQQPGMTGQVKEEILTRLGELGAGPVDGCLRFAPELLAREEFFPEARAFSYVDLAGEERSLEMPADSLGFTYCQVPVCYTLAGAAAITVTRADGRTETVRGQTLSAADSAAVFRRTGEIRRLSVAVAGAML